MDKRILFEIAQNYLDVLEKPVFRVGVYSALNDEDSMVVTQLFRKLDARYTRQKLTDKDIYHTLKEL